MNDVDKKIFQNKKEIEELNNKLNSKLIELKEIEEKIKMNDDELALLKKENKNNILKKLFNILKVTFIPLIINILLGITINKYCYFGFMIILFYLILRFIRDTKYERYNLSKESINKFKSNRNYYLEIKKRIDEEIGESLIKVEDLKKINLELGIKSKEIKVREDSSLIEIEKYLSQKTKHN